MNEEMYQELNSYLNECFIYLNKTNPIFIKYLNIFFHINNNLYNNANKKIIKYYRTEENNLTYEEVLSLSRQIIKEIDENYLEKFDNLLSSGELHFEYDESNTSEFQYDKSKNIKTIDIYRKFNYDDVIVLIHEFVHYTNSFAEMTYMRDFLTEFISIYFEEYARNYLIENISDDNIKKSINERIINTLIINDNLYSYITLLLGYEYLGDLNKNTKNDLRKIMKIENNVFEQECMKLLNKFRTKVELTLKDFCLNYKYVFGTLLTYYALENVEVKKMVKLNNDINSYEYSLMNLEEVLETIGVEFNFETLNKSVEYFNKNIYEEGKIK